MRHDEILLRNLLNTLTTKSRVKIYVNTEAEVVNHKLYPVFDDLAYKASTELWDELGYVVDKIKASPDGVLLIFTSER